MSDNKSVFDTEGVVSYYFMFTALVVYLVPATYWRIFGQDYTKAVPTGNKQFDALCVKKVLPKPRKSQKAISTRTLIYFFALAALVWVVGTIHTFESVADEHFDPFLILDVETSASDGEIKKAYRKLSKELHPDKNLEDPATAEYKFVRATKAYQTLTDEKSKDNWEKYGHPDGPQAQESNFAIPSWIVDDDNRWMVVAFYFLGFMIFLPTFVANTWWSSRRYSLNHKVLRQTMGAYFQFSQPEMPMETLLQVISASVEFLDEVPVGNSAAETSALKEISDKFTAEGDALINAPYCIKARNLLLAHMNRIDVPEVLVADLSKTLSLIPDLIQYGLIPTLSGKSLTGPTLATIQLQQFLIQGSWKDVPPLMFLPHMSIDFFKDNDKMPKPPIMTKFISMKRDEKREWLKDLTDEQFKEVETVAESMPSVLLDAHLGVNGMENIIEKSIVTVTIVLERVTLRKQLERFAEMKAMRDAGENPQEIYSPGGVLKKKVEEPGAPVQSTKDDFDDDEWEESQRGSKPKPRGEKPPGQSPIVYCPRFPNQLMEGWWIMLSTSKPNQFGTGDQKQLIVFPRRIDDLTDSTEIELIFQAPEKAGKYAYELDIMSDCYIGTAFKQILRFEVHKAPAAAAVPEPEEDSEEEQNEEESSSEEESELESDSE